MTHGEGVDGRARANKRGKKYSGQGHVFQVSRLLRIIFDLPEQDELKAYYSQNENDKPCSFRA
jgi:hypothetical protein